MFEYFKDGFNPRGYEYGATARAADAARRNAEATEDLLALELAGDRNAMASRIQARRKRDASRRAFWHNLDGLLALVFVVTIGWVMFGPSIGAPQSAVTQSAAVTQSQDPDNANAPAIPARAPAHHKHHKHVHVAVNTDAQ